MNNKQAAFLPFHAINEFMTDEYRQEVVRSVLLNQEKLPESFQSALNRLAKKTVVVPGFRNGAKAPASLKIKPFIQAFEKNPQIVAEVIAAWCELHSELRTQVFELLVSFGWELLPPDADRTRLPGFLPQWPDERDFDQINQEFKDRYPDAQVNTQVTTNDVSLMVVWLSVRLPVEMSTRENTAESSLQPNPE